MRIGIFLGNFPPEAGGGFSFEQEIVRALSELNIQHNIIVFGNLSQQIIDSLSTKGYEVVPTQRSNFELKRYGFIRFTAKVLNRLRLGKIHNLDPHTSWLKTTSKIRGIEIMWYPTSIYLEADVPYIYTVFDLQHRLQPWFPEVGKEQMWLAREKYYSKVLRRATKIITGNESGRREISNFYNIPIDRICLLPHPTPRNLLDTGEHSLVNVVSKYNLPEEYILYPAQFWPHKNHTGLLHALNYLKEKKEIEIAAVFTGSDHGNLPHVHDVINDLELNSLIHILGFVPGEDLVGLYRNAFALVYPSYFGPENLPPLEAFSCGCPVIAADVSGAEEQLGDAALLVDPNDEVAIAEAILRLRDDSDLYSTLVHRGKERADQWTTYEFVNQILVIIDEFQPIRRNWGS